MTRTFRGLAHLAAIVGLAAWALALGRWLRDPDLAGGIGLAVVLVLVAAAVRQLYRPGGLLAPEPGLPRNVKGLPRNVKGLPPNVEGGTPVREVEHLFDARVDLNGATLEDLVTLPGVGPVAARRILDEREAGGPFASVEALTRVPGFGAAKVRALADRVRV